MSAPGLDAGLDQARLSTLAGPAIPTHPTVVGEPVLSNFTRWKSREPSGQKKPEARKESKAPPSSAMNTEALDLARRSPQEQSPPRTRAVHTARPPTRGRHPSHLEMLRSSTTGPRVGMWPSEQAVAKDRERGKSHGSSGHLRSKQAQDGAVTASARGTAVQRPRAAHPAGNKPRTPRPLPGSRRPADQPPHLGSFFLLLSH